LTLLCRAWALGPAALLLALIRPADGVSIARDPRQGIMFTSHHKTGTVLSLELEVCFVGGRNASSSMRVLAKRCKESRSLEDLNWNGWVPLDCARLVHFVRNPREIVRSGYLYHRKVPAVEMWLLRPALEIMGEAVPDNPFLPDETYHDYLQRVPYTVGVYAEMKSFSGQVLADMENAHQASRDDPRVLTMCLEEGWIGYEDMVRKVADHLDLPMNDEVSRCAARHNPSKHNFASHVTQNALAPDEMAQLRDIIARLDEEWFGGRFGSSPLATLCRATGTIGRMAAAGRGLEDEEDWLEGYG